jgi:hypothetical protein
MPIQNRKAALKNAREIGCHISMGASGIREARIPECGNRFRSKQEDVLRRSA